MRRGIKAFKKAAIWFSALFTAGALFIMYTPVSNMMARPLVMEPEIQKAGIIAVLGGGAYKNGALGQASNERLLSGMLLYREGLAPKIIFSGGSILEPSKKIMHTVMRSDAAGDMGAVEARLMEETALSLGIPVKDCAVDAGSTNTYENLKNVKGYMAENGLETCLIVTSPTHMRRSALVARKLGMNFHPAPVTDYTRYRTSALERLNLFHEAMWEYAGLVLYKVYGYI